MKPISINYYLTAACNYKCRFCYSRCLGKGAKPLTRDESHKLLGVFQAAGCQKVTFGGGEPTLHLYLSEMITTAKRLGMTTSLVTNGAAWALY